MKKVCCFPTSHLTYQIDEISHSTLNLFRSKFYFFLLLFYFKIFSNDEQCHSCGFPLCQSKNCQNGKWHSRLECKMFSQNQQLFVAGKQFETFNSLRRWTVRDNKHLKMLNSYKYLKTSKNVTTLIVQSFLLQYNLYNSINLRWKKCFCDNAETFSFQMMIESKFLILPGSSLLSDFFWRWKIAQMKVS
jgi:hypothetical protein